MTTPQPPPPVSDDGNEANSTNAGDDLRTRLAELKQQIDEHLKKLERT
jgi:hypothetical protein